jgi:hypothetical protein
MTRLDVATGRGTTRARRWLTRALFVVGGAMAGTAAAWAISTANAAADPALDSSCLPHLTGAASDVVHPASKHRDHEGGCDREVVPEVRGAVGTVADDELAHPARNVADSLDLITGPPPQAPRVVGDTLRPAPGLLDILRPESGDLLQVPALPLAEPKAETGAMPISAHAPLAAPDGQIPVESAQAAADPRGNDGEHTAARAGRHTLGHPLPGSVPLSPSPTPLTPPALPLPGGSATNGHVDGPVYGIPAPAPGLTAADGARCLRFGIRHLPVESGTQPGVTPD